MDPIIESLRQRFSFRSHMLEASQSTNPNIVKLAKVRSKITSMVPNFPSNIKHSNLNSRTLNRHKPVQNQNSPLIRITPSSLQKIQKKCVTVSRNQCYDQSDYKEQDKNRKQTKTDEKTYVKQQQCKVDSSREQDKKKVYKTALLRSRISTHFDIDLQIRKNNKKIKKCCCGDCEECLKDFSYFLHLVPSDKSLPEISAKSWSVWKHDLQTGKFFHYHGKNIHKPRHIASLTKMLTAMIAIDFLKTNNYEPDKVLYQVKKSSILIGGTSANLQIGQVYTITQLIYAMMLPSGNDASLAVAEAVGGLSLLKSKNKQVDPYISQWCSQNSLSQQFQRQSLYHFISLMQQKCSKLGLHSTSIYNPHGNDAFSIPNTSTSNQLCRLSAQYLQKYPTLKSISSSKIYTVQRYNKKWENTNKLLEDGFEGIKTGINEVSGPCLSACYRDYIVVVLSSKSVGDRWLQVKKLVRWMVMKP